MELPGLIEFLVALFAGVLAGYFLAIHEPRKRQSRSRIRSRGGYVETISNVFRQGQVVERLELLWLPEGWQSTEDCHGLTLTHLCCGDSLHFSKNGSAQMILNTMLLHRCRHREARYPAAAS